MVTVLDIREESSDHALADGLLSGIGGADEQDEGARVLIIDHLDVLAERQSLYATVLSSKAVKKLLCLAVGEPSSDGVSSWLQLCPVINAFEDAGTLWIGDPVGIEWEMDQGWIGAPLPGDGHPQRTLRMLVEALRAHSVFDQVLAGLRAIPHAVAVPGVRVTKGSVGTDSLATALIRGLELLTAGDRGHQPIDEAGGELRTGDPAQSRVLASLAGDPADDPDLPDPIVPGSPLYRLRQECQGRLQDLHAAVRVLPSVRVLPGPSRPGPHLFRVIGDAHDVLKRYRDTLDDLFERADSRDGLDQAKRDLLADHGVRVPGRGAEADEVPTALRIAVRTELERRTSLRTLISRLRGYAVRAAPSGSLTQRGRLLRACPDDLLSRLAKPPPFVLRPWPALWPVVAVLGAVAGLLAGSAAGPAVGAVVLAALGWALATAFLEARTPVPGGERGWARVRFGGPLLQGLMLLAGGLLGRVARTQPSLGGRPAGLPGPVLTVTAVLLGLSALGVLTVWWRRSVASWRAAIPVAEASRASAELDRLLRTVALREWVLADERRSAADMAQTLAVVVQDLLSALRAGIADYGASLPPASGGRGVRSATSRLREYTEELSDIVADDLFDLATHVLEPFWSQTAGRHGPTDVGDHATRVLDDYWLHLRKRGVHEPPRFGRDNPRRDELAEIIWRQSAHVAEVVTQPVGGRMTQLCSERDLGLLRGGARFSRLTRFAPRAAQPRLGLASSDTGWTPPDDVVWTSTTEFAGSVRLVPLRDGAVRVQWAVNDQGGYDEGIQGAGPDDD